MLDEDVTPELGFSEVLPAQRSVPAAGQPVTPVRAVTPARLARLSVVIATYNRADELALQLESLCGQHYPQWWEVVVVDNRSTDHTADVVQRFAGRLAVRYLTADERQSRAHALNVGVAAAGGEAVVTLDSDDMVAPGYLEAMGAVLAWHSFAGARLDTARLNVPAMRLRRAEMQSTGLDTLMRHQPVVVGAGFGVSRAAFLAVGGCDESMQCLEDVDLSWRLQYGGHRPVFVPDAVVHYRYRPGLWSTWQQERAYGRWEAVLYAKHRPYGLPRRRLRTVIAGWAAVLTCLADAGSASGRARLVTVLAAAVGRLEGSLRTGVLCL